MAAAPAAGAGLVRVPPASHHAAAPAGRAGEQDGDPGGRGRRPLRHLDGAPACVGREPERGPAGVVALHVLVLVAARCRAAHGQVVDAHPVGAREQRAGGERHDGDDEGDAGGGEGDPEGPSHASKGAGGAA